MQVKHMDAALTRIGAALDSATGPVDFFFRDDDIGWGDDRLWPLLDVFVDLRLPVDLAVIPKELTEGVARELLARADDSTDLLRFHQHGYAHVNHEPEGRKYEFGQSRSRIHQLRDISDGRRLLHDLLGPSTDAIFTPPWNRCTFTTGRCIAELGFDLLSREARATPMLIPGLAELPINVDWLAHKKGVRLTPADFGELTVNAIESGKPVGVMFHHAVMDVEERAAARDLLELVAAHPAAVSNPMAALAEVAGDGVER